MGQVRSVPKHFGPRVRGNLIKVAIIIGTDWMSDAS